MQPLDSEGDVASFLVTKFDHETSPDRLSFTDSNRESLRESQLTLCVGAQADAKVVHRYAHSLDYH